MMELRSYSSPFNVGHKALEDFWTGEVYVQEKIDGSQFSFGIRDGQLICRSRNQMIEGDPGMFDLGVGYAQELFTAGKLTEGWTYRGEYLRKPRHNTLRYGRAPQNYIILFDIDKGDQDYILPTYLPEIAAQLGLEAVPLLGVLDARPPLEELKRYLNELSLLGEVKIEGIVLKNYKVYDRGHKVLMAKLVADDFREKHTRSWAKQNPSQTALVDDIIQMFRTEARWTKARQHLREAGLLEGSPRDIPALMREVSEDIFREEKEEIAERLFKYFWKQISRGVTKGLPEWYKETLIEEAFDGGA